MNDSSSSRTPVSHIHLLWTIPTGIGVFLIGGGMGASLTGSFLIVLGAPAPMLYLADAGFYFWGAFAVQLFRKHLANRRGLAVNPDFLYRWPVLIGLLFGSLAVVKGINAVDVYR